MLRDPAAPAASVGPAWIGRARARFAGWRQRYGPRTADVLGILLALAVGVAQLVDDPAGSFPIGKPASWVVLVLSGAAMGTARQNATNAATWTGTSARRAKARKNPRGNGASGPDWA